MIKRLRRKEFNERLTHSTAHIKTFPGATSKHLFHHIIPTLEDAKFEAIVIHVGVNDLLRKTPIRNIIQNLTDITSLCRRSNIKTIFISSIIHTPRLDFKLVYEANKEIKKFCHLNNFNMIENFQITKYNLAKDNLHIGLKGLSIFTNNLILSMNYFFTNFFFETKS